MSNCVNGVTSAVSADAGCDPLQAYVRVTSHHEKAILHTYTTHHSPVRALLYTTLRRYRQAPQAVRGRKPLPSDASCLSWDHTIRSSLGIRMKSLTYGSTHVEIITASRPAKLARKVGVRVVIRKDLSIFVAVGPLEKAGYLAQDKWHIIRRSSHLRRRICLFFVHGVRHGYWL